jgi:predicted pyridoxine 5'-phosphate oxidase superfamily flavin-nucleotide-binding protein
MVKLPEEVKKIFEEKTGPAFIATVDVEGKPNVAPKGSLNVLDNEHLRYTESTGKKTYENIKKNPSVAVVVLEKRRGYQIKGKAELITEGPFYEAAVKRTEKVSRRLGVEMRKPIAAVRIKVEEIYSI